MNVAQSSQGPFKVGDKLLKFEIRGIIGRGGQAIVYEGWDDFLKRRVAIKIVTDPAPDLARRAQAEAQILCSLHHPNIVHVIDAGFTDDRVIYIVMELLAGRTLRQVLWQLGRLSVVEALTIGAQIADGVQVAHAHDEPVIHRDLKPENVFILPGNAAKVLDFGIAKFVTRNDMTTQRNLRRGTVSYMSPEQLQGLEIMPSTDVYSLGTILYEAIAGIRPCEIGKTDPTPESTMWHQLSRMPPQLDRFVAGVPVQVARAIQRMLAKKPAQRFSNMAEVSEVLRAQCSGIVEGARRGPAVQLRRLWDASAFPSPTPPAADPFIAQTKTGAMVFTAQPTTPQEGLPAKPASDAPLAQELVAQPSSEHGPSEVAPLAQEPANRFMLPTVENRLEPAPVAPQAPPTPRANAKESQPAPTARPSSAVEQATAGSLLTGSWWLAIIAFLVALGGGYVIRLPGYSRLHNKFTARGTEVSPPVALRVPPKASLPPVIMAVPIPSTKDSAAISVPASRSEPSISAATTKEMSAPSATGSVAPLAPPLGAKPSTRAVAPKNRRTIPPKVDTFPLVPKDDFVPWGATKPASNLPKKHLQVESK